MVEYSLASPAIHDENDEHGVNTLSSAASVNPPRKPVTGGDLTLTAQSAGGEVLPHNTAEIQAAGP